MAVNQTIASNQVAEYAVCPEAFRLKDLDRDLRSAEKRKETQPQADSAKQARTEWSRSQELRNDFLKYSKVIMLLLSALLLAVFFLDKYDLLAPDKGAGFARQIAVVPLEILLLIFILALLTFLWDLFYRRGNAIGEEGGVSKAVTVVAAKGGSVLDSTHLYSKSLGLRAEPHALLEERSMRIPMDLHPNTNRVRDRHVLSLLVSLRILDEEQKNSPTHGFLLMGSKRRKVRIEYNPERKRWLESVVEEMRAIRSGVPAVARPGQRKCRNCDVSGVCEFSAV